MRLLSCVLTVLVVVAVGTAGSATTGGNLTYVAARLTPSASPCPNETIVVTSKLGKLHEHAARTTEDKDSPFEERGPPVLTKGAKKLLRSTSDILGLKKGATLLRSTSEILGLNKGATPFRSTSNILKSGSSRVLAGNIGKLGAAKTLVVDGKVCEMNKFVKLLGVVIKPDQPFRIYEDVVKYLTKAKTIHGKLLPRVHVKDLVAAIDLLRKVHGMETHANRLQDAVTVRFPLFVEEKLFPQWLRKGLTPQDVFEILPLGRRDEFLSLMELHKKNNEKFGYDQTFGLMHKYIVLYRAEHNFDEKAEKDLLQFYSSAANDRSTTPMWERTEVESQVRMRNELMVPRAAV